MISENDKRKLHELNSEVYFAISKRREWLNSKMVEYAVVPIGEEIYDLHNGALLGVVSGYYRYWRDKHEGALDKSLDIHYEYRVPGDSNFFDNTSNKNVSVGTKQDLIADLKIKARSLSESNYYD